MRKSIVCGCGIMLAALVIGCGSSGPEAVIKEQLSIMDQMTSIMQKVTDKKSFDEAGVKIKELTERAKELEKKAKGFTADQMKGLEEKYKPQLEASAKKFAEASMNAMTKALGGLKDFKLPNFPK
ncbi:MAG TPA: hypothetical protein VKE98_08540 [Gemmataceae bacterium]|nr:hypothetical protein [Gemmataceae bacterium]